jgi:hypothetical protein
MKRLGKESPRRSRSYPKAQITQGADRVSAPTRRCRIDGSGLVTTQRVWHVTIDATLTKKTDGLPPLKVPMN